MLANTDESTTTNIFLKKTNLVYKFLVEKDGKGGSKPPKD